MTDTNVIVVCEGQTERTFCNSVVAPHMATKGISLAGTLVGRAHNKAGGIRTWAVYRKELIRLAKERKDRHVAVLVDYYAMPNDWPGRSASINAEKKRRGQVVEDAIRQDLLADLPGRVHPCIQLHEFESLLFVAPDVTSRNLTAAAGKDDHIPLMHQLQQIKNDFAGSVESINDSHLTAPSRRIKALAGAYDKADVGPTIAAEVKLPALRAGCPWLDRWLTSLEQLSPTTC